MMIREVCRERKLQKIGDKSSKSCLMMSSGYRLYQVHDLKDKSKTKNQKEKAVKSKSMAENDPNSINHDPSDFSFEMPVEKNRSIGCFLRIQNSQELIRRLEKSIHLSGNRREIWSNKPRSLEREYWKR